MTLWYRIHAWTGLIAGLLILVISVSGVIVIFKPEIERIVEPAMQPVHAVGDAPRLSVDELVSRFEAEHPHDEVLAVRLPAIAGTKWSHGRAMSLTVRPRNGEGGSWEVVVDPSTAAELGRRKPGDSWGQWLRDLHVRLFMGYWGRVFIGAFGLVMLLSTVSALVIFRRFNKGSWWPSIRWGRGLRIVSADWHKTIGMATLVLSLIFAVTGAVLGLENLWHRYLKPEPQRVHYPDRIAADLPGILEQCVRRAPEIFPGAGGFEVSDLSLPRDDRPIVTVHVEHPAHHLVREHTSYVQFNSTTGEVFAVEDARQAGVGARLYYAAEPLHFGRLGGLMAVKLLYAFMGIAIGGLSITGYMIYVARKWKKWRGAGRALAMGENSCPPADRVAPQPALRSVEPEAQM